MRLACGRCRRSGCFVKVIYYSMPDRVYLDWNATAPLRREAREAMAVAFDLAATRHRCMPRAAGPQMVEGVAMMAGAVGALPRNVIFTSGGTEANAMALHPGFRRGPGLPVKRLLVSAIEHASVLRAAASRRRRSDTIGVTASGLVDIGRLRELLRGKPPTLVSLMLANNETGAIQPVAEAARNCPRRGRPAACRCDPGIWENTS